MKNTNSIFSFEEISTEGSFAIKGGFSGSFQSSYRSEDDPDDSDGSNISNNCSGGNCAFNCGPYSNDGCNTVRGCGKG